MGKFFKEGAYTYVSKKAIKAINEFKTNPIKTSGTALGWVIAPGEEIARVSGVGPYVKDNTLIDDFMLFGFPAVPLLYESKKLKPEMYLGTPENQRKTEKKWESRGQKGIKHSIREGY